VRGFHAARICVPSTGVTSRRTQTASKALI